MKKIMMSKKSTPTIEEAFDLFIRKCKIKNLTDLSISSYEKKMIHFYEFKDKTDLITTVTADTMLFCKLNGALFCKLFEVVSAVAA